MGWAHKAVALGRELADEELLGKAYHKLGIAYEKAGDLRAAIDSLEESLAWEESEDVRDRLAFVRADLCKLADEAKCRAARSTCIPFTRRSRSRARSSRTSTI